MYALSTRQPRPFSLFRLGNPYSNHYWRPRGWMIGRRIAIHATGHYCEETEDVIVRLLGVKPKGMRESPKCAIVGVANLAEVIPFDKTNSRWAFGPLCWRFERIVEFPSPIECHLGRPGLWKLPKELVFQVREQLRLLEEEARRMEAIP